jgi:Swt1-like HEPN
MELNSMNSEFENPFAGYGNIVFGERFIGRINDIRVIENRVIRPNEPGNLAIVGDYRVGKSSLAYKVFIEPKFELTKRRLLPIWLNLATHNDISEFFETLVTCCFDELCDLGWVTETIKLAAGNVHQSRLTWAEKFGRIQRFFEQVRKAKIRVIFILDEFDHARHLFKENISGFQALRELSYRPEWRVTFVTISRRSLRDIELQTNAISTFDLTFSKLYLALFDELDIQEFFTRLASSGVAVSSELNKEIISQCGSHPFLLDILGYEIVEMFRENKAFINIDEAIERCAGAFIDQYDHIVDILNEDDSLKKMLQILFGPVIDVKQSDVDSFTRYGLIKLKTNGEYTAFSENFQLYLKLIVRQVNLWPIWRETEILLRNNIDTVMMRNYGEKWVDALEKKHPKLNALFERCRASQSSEEKSFGSRASHNLIEFTYPHELFAIIFAEWNVFQPILGKDRNYWDQRAQVLAKIRNPLAHNRDKILYDYEIKIAEGFCQEICEILHNNK